MNFRTALICLPLLLAACGDNKARFVIAPSEAASEVRLRVSSIEVRDVSLPSYASASEIVVEDADGALRPAAKAIWADDPQRGITAALARSLDLKSTATVAAEPWPLSEGPAVQLTVRVDQMTARADGRFVFSGQYALSSPDGTLRERLERFAIDVPMADSTPATVANATGRAIDALADEVLTRLRR